MEIKINGKTLLLGLALTGAFTFGEYVSIISGGGYISQAAIPEENGSYVTESGETATGGYKVWSDGLKEEWGMTNENVTISFKNPYTKINTVNIQITRTNETTPDLNAVPQVKELTLSDFKPWVNGGTAQDNVFWIARGY